MEREAVLRAIGENGFDFEAAVLQRYGEAAREVESCLCLPVSYNPGLDLLSLERQTGDAETRRQRERACTIDLVRVFFHGIFCAESSSQRQGF